MSNTCMRKASNQVYRGELSSNVFLLRVQCSSLFYKVLLFLAVFVKPVLCHLDIMQSLPVGSCLTALENMTIDSYTHTE